MESGFFAVWDRVTGAKPQEDEQTRLRRWLRDEAAGVRAYGELLRFSSDKQARETLRQLISEKKKQVKSLQTMYFLRTGDTCVLDIPKAAKPTSLLQGLRAQYALELSQSESYEKANDDRSDLKALCADLSREKRSMAARMRSLAQRLL